MEITKHFPFLVPQDEKGLVYSGFIEVAGQHLQLKVCTPYGNDDMTDFSMDCDHKMASLLNSKKELVKQRVKMANDLLEFLIELRVILENESKSQRNVFDVTANNFYSCLMDQISSIGWDNVCHVSSNLHELELKAKDAKERCHVIKLTLTEQFPNNPPIWNTSLPVNFQFKWSSNPNLKYLYINFCGELQKYQEFWSIMDDIDANTWVLEPEKPSLADTSRRIAIMPTASILLMINPLQPKSIPDFTFLGPDKMTEPLKEKLLSSDLYNWDANLSVLDNIRQLLGIELPRPSDSKEEDYKLECGICYTHLLNESAPDCACDNEQCGQLYHRTCIYEWLLALPDRRQSFNVIFGECPYCCKVVGVKIPSSK